MALWAGYLAHRGPAALKDRLDDLERSRSSPARSNGGAPYGVVGVITPWNYPFTLPVTDSLPALLVGNAVVLKPDDKTPHTALYALSLLEEAGAPGLLQIVLGDGPRSGERSFSTPTTWCSQGRRRRAGPSQPLRRSADRILRRAGWEEPAARAGRRGCRTGRRRRGDRVLLENSGQLCISMERIYVHDSQWDAFTHRFLEHVSAMDVRAGLTWEADMGSLISAQQLETVTRHVDDAVAQGARVLAGGRARPDLGPYFYEPTVLTDVQAGMEAHSGETFGPVVSLYRAQQRRRSDRCGE